MLVKIIIGVLSLVVSVFLATAALELLVPGADKEGFLSPFKVQTSEIDSEPPGNEILCSTLEDELDRTNCLITQLESLENEATESTTANVNIDNYEMLSDPVFIVVFYITIASLTITLYIFSTNMLSIPDQVGKLSSWAIDAPPVAGVCGTLYALVNYLREVGGLEDASGFLVAFSFAAVTTILGAGCSVLNQFLLSFKGN